MITEFYFDTTLLSRIYNVVYFNQRGSPTLSMIRSSLVIVKSPFASSLNAGSTNFSFYAVGVCKYIGCNIVDIVIDYTGFFLPCSNDCC